MDINIIFIYNLRESYQLYATAGTQIQKVTVRAKTRKITNLTNAIDRAYNQLYNMAS